MSITELLKRIEAEQRHGLEWINKHFETIGDGHFSVVDISGTEFPLFPYPEFSAMIYRGQSKFFDPCLPSMYRDRSSKIDRLVNLIRIAEFELLLTNHPAVKYLSNWSIGDLKFRVDYEAMAQHYNMKTRLMDFSSVPMIAAFFACSEYDASGGGYRPIMDINHEPGVIYRINTAFDLEQHHENPRSGAVGLQPLRRPAEQYAWSYRLSKNTSLNRQKFMSFMPFRHSPTDSVKIFDAFEGGAKLFPHDPIADKAQKIASLCRFSSEAFRLASQRVGSKIRIQSTINKLYSKGFEIADQPGVTLSPHDVDIMEQDWNNRILDILSKIQMRFVHYPM